MTECFLARQRLEDSEQEVVVAGSASVSQALTCACFRSLPTNEPMACEDLRAHLGIVT